MANNAPIFPLQYITLHPCQPSPFPRHFHRISKLFPSIQTDTFQRHSVLICLCRWQIILAQSSLPIRHPYLSTCTKPTCFGYQPGRFRLLSTLCSFDFRQPMKPAERSRASLPRPYPRPCMSVAPYRKPTMWTSDRVPDQKMQKRIPIPIIYYLSFATFWNP